MSVANCLTLPLQKYHEFVATPTRSLRETALKTCTLLMSIVIYPFLIVLNFTGRVVIWLSSPVGKATRVLPSVVGQKLNQPMHRAPNQPVLPRTNPVVEKALNHPTHWALNKPIRRPDGTDLREQAVRLARHHRLDDPAQELERLKKAGVLDQAAELLLDKASEELLKGIACPIHRDFVRNLHIKSKAILAQALEIKKIYQDEYDVFTHSQSSQWVLNTYLIKELFKKNRPDIDLHQFKPLRIPAHRDDPKILDALLGKFGWGIPFTDWDLSIRELLLSVDAYFFNYSLGESALSFLCGNGSMLQASHEATEKIIQYFYPQISPDHISNAINRLQSTISKKQFKCGNLLVVCIPKNANEKIYYRSHAGGIPCGCHSKEKAREILDKLQNDVLDQTTDCLNSNGRTPKIPQYRLYIPRINPIESKIFLLSPLERNKRKELKQSIRDIVSDLHNVSA